MKTILEVKAMIALIIEEMDRIPDVDLFVDDNSDDLLELEDYLRELEYYRRKGKMLQEDSEASRWLRGELSTLDDLS